MTKPRKSAYDRVMELKLADNQAAQRSMSPEKVAQRVLREWLGVQGVIDPMAGAVLVRKIEAAIVAERANGEEPKR